MNQLQRAVRRKAYTLRVRMTPEEQAHAQRLAEIADASISEVVRHLLANARVIVHPPTLHAFEDVNHNRAALDSEAQRSAVAA
jgi:hypothetical protein